MNEATIRERFSIPASYELSLDVGEPIDLAIRGIGCAIFIGSYPEYVCLDFGMQVVQSRGADGLQITTPFPETL